MRAGLAPMHAVVAVSTLGSVLLAALWLAVAALVGDFGRRKGYSFWLGFLLTALLSVVVGFVALVLCRDRASGRRGFITGADPVELPDGL
jgi:ABC-type uncharacterized transport system permease subunit